MKYLLMKFFSLFIIILPSHVYGQYDSLTIDQLKNIQSKIESQIENLSNNLTDIKNQISLKEKLGKIPDSLKIQSDENKLIVVRNTMLYADGSLKGIEIIPAKTILYYLQKKDGKYTVEYNNLIGWIYDYEVLDQETRKANDAKAKEYKKANDAKAKEQKIATEKRKQILIAKYGQSDGIRIFEGKIWIGMSKEMVLDSWGKPGKINRTVSSWGVHEQWIYNDVYVYIENEKVTSWQD